MKEDIIRPLHLRKENAILEQEDAFWMLQYAPSFINVSCPACESTSFSFSFEKLGYKFVECEYCYTVFVNPRPTQNLLHQYYISSKNVLHWANEIMPFVEDNRRKYIYRPRAEKVSRLIHTYSSRHKDIWDIGACTGVLCEELVRLNIFEEVIAVEVTPDSVQKCIEKGIKVHEKSVEQIESSNCVDVIVGFEIIEHLFSPKDFINVCHRLLRPSGMLILSTPNIWGFELSVLGENSSNICAPAHLNYFCPISLRALLERYGFEVVEISTPGQLDVDIVRSIDNRSNLPVFLRRMLFNMWNKKLGNALQYFLSDNLLSSHMQIVARKI